MSMVALLLLSGCTTAAAGSTVVSTPTVGATPSSVDAQRVPGEPAVVTRIVDGDTIRVTFHGQDLDVRLIGIDTPETVDPSQSGAVLRGAGVSLHAAIAHRQDRAVGVRRGSTRSVRTHARVRVVGRTTVQPAARSSRLRGRRHVSAERSLRGCLHCGAGGGATRGPWAMARMSRRGAASVRSGVSRRLHPLAAPGSGLRGHPLPPFPGTRT